MNDVNKNGLKVLMRPTVEKMIREGDSELQLTYHDDEDAEIDVTLTVSPRRVQP